MRGSEQNSVHDLNAERYVLEVDGAKADPTIFSITSLRSGLAAVKRELAKMPRAAPGCERQGHSNETRGQL